MKDVLIQSGLAIPSNSATKYLEMHGVPFNERLGGNCVFQIEAMLDMLGDVAREKALFLTSFVDNVLHYATVIQEGGEQYYLDPFLMHTEPVNVKDIFKGGLMVEAYPIGNKVAFQHTGARTFQATLYRPGKGVQFDQVRRYQFDLDQSQPELPAYDEYAVPDPKKMSMRVINRTADELLIMHYHLQTAGMNIVRYLSSGMSESTKQKTQPDEFEHQLQRIASIALLQKGLIYDTFYQAHYYATEGY